MKANFILILLTLFVLEPLHAENILFIGNSYTHGHDPAVKEHGGLPAIFKTVADSLGKTVTIAMSAPSGKDWGYHLSYEPTLKKIRKGGWDRVIIQNSGDKPTHAGNLQQHLRDGVTLSEQIWEASPKAEVILYETAAHHLGSSHYGDDPEKHKFTGPAAMIREVQDGYRQLKSTLKERFPDHQILTAHVGTAFDKC